MTQKEQNSSNPNPKAYENESCSANSKSSNDYEIEIIPDKEIRIRYHGILTRKLFLPKNGIIANQSQGDNK